VVAQYRADSEYVSCGDAFTANATLAAINIYDDTINDSSSCSQSIITPTILKKIVQIYYRNLDVKTSSTAVAPLDWIEYELSFDCSSITAAKRNILLDDFFPLETGMPVIEDVEQISGTPIVPVLIAPHGLRWNLGNVIDETPWVVRFKTQVGTSLTQSNLSNLFKLTGTTNAKTSYSDRKQTTILTGKPNLVITRYFDGFTPTNVYGGVEYSCRIKIANTQNETDSATDAFGFQFAEQTYNGITIVSDSWSASGTGLFTVPQGSSTFITAQILRLYVGQDITISYKVILPANIYPGFTGSLAAQAGIPYTQIIDSLLENVMYSMTSLSSSAQLKTRSLTFGKSYSDSDVKVGSIVHYTVQYMVPKGTAIYNAKLADDLPSGQALVGDVLLNGSTISVTVENQKITFPEVSVVNSTASDVTMVYTFTAVINSAAIVFPTTTQINTATLTYKNYLNSASTRTATRNVIIAHPLLTITLTPLNGTLLDSKTTFNMRVDMDNKSVIGARECQIQLPIPNDAVYVSSFSQLGSVSLNGSVLTWNIGNVSGLQKGSLSFSFKGNSNLLVTDSITYIATLLNYKNDLSDSQIVEGAVVKIMDKDYNPISHAITGDDGKYIFTPFAPGTDYHLYVSAVGYNLETINPFTLNADQTLTKDVTLHADTKSTLSFIAGDITTDAGVAIMGAVVQLFSVVDTTETLIGLAFSNQYGQYAFRELEKGTYRIRISALGYLVSTAEVSITKDSSITKVVTKLTVDPVTSKGTVSGIITDETDNPVVGADVILYRVEDDESLTPIALTQTISGGVYLFVNTTPGNYKVKSTKTTTLV